MLHEGSAKRGITPHARNRLLLAKCYCGFVCETEGELKSHIVKVHGARDGDWKGWVSRESG
jgi:hypothetical protein